MPSFEELVIQRLELQVGAFTSQIIQRDIKIEILLEERQASQELIAKLGGELPPSQIVVRGEKPDVGDTNQDTGDSGAGETAGETLPLRRAFKQLPSDDPAEARG